MYDRRNPADPLGRMVECGPLFTFGQFARANGLSGNAARNLIDRYWTKNLVNILDIACKQIPSPERCTYRHEPGLEVAEELPRTLAITFAARYRAAESKEIRIYTPTRKALQIFGSPHARPPLTTHATHDLLLTEIFLANRHRGRWLLEPEPPGGREIHEKQPDAAIFNGGKLPDVFIECCGSYRADRIADLLKFSEGSGIPFEMW